MSGQHIASRGRDMNQNNPGFWLQTWCWLQTNAPTLYGSGAAFAMALLVDIWQGRTVGHAICSGGICWFVALALITSLESFGLNPDNAFLVGVFIGGIGVGRCLTLIQFVVSSKTNVRFDNNERGKNEDK